MVTPRSARWHADAKNLKGQQVQQEVPIGSKHHVEMTANLWESTDILKLIKRQRKTTTATSHRIPAILAILCSILCSSPRHQTRSCTDDLSSAPGEVSTRIPHHRTRAAGCRPATPRRPSRPSLPGAVGCPSPPPTAM